MSKIVVLALRTPQRLLCGVDFEDTSINMSMCCQVGAMLCSISRVIHNAQARSAATDDSMAVAMGVPPRVPWLRCMLCRGGLQAVQKELAAWKNEADLRALACSELRYILALCTLSGTSSAGSMSVALVAWMWWRLRSSH